MLFPSASGVFACRAICSISGLIGNSTEGFGNRSGRLPSACFLVTDVPEFPGDGETGRAAEIEAEANRKRSDGLPPT